MSMFDARGSEAASRTPISSEDVEFLHRNADTDARTESIHHTLGNSGTQAAKGDHNHDGTNGALLLTGMTISGSRGSATSMPSIIAALVRLGATDQTSA